MSAVLSLSATSLLACTAGGGEGGLPLSPSLPVPADRLPARREAFLETECEVTIPDHAMECGLIQSEQAGPGSEPLWLAVAQVFSNSNAPKDDPVVYLDGGPGQATLSELSSLYPALEVLSPDRDFVFLDQRGVGQSLPSLVCLETGSPDEVLEQCHARLSAALDLSVFNTRRSAEDVERVREVLGYSRWNLLGVSYGTRLALTVVRDYPNGVRSAVLDSVVPLERNVLAELGANTYRALERVFALCSQSRACAEAHPDPMSQLRAIVAQLNRSPLDMGDWFLDGNRVAKLAFDLVQSTPSAGTLLELLDAMSSGDFSDLEPLDPARGQDDGFALGLHLSAYCSEEIPFSGRDEFDAWNAAVPEDIRSALSGEEYLARCARWAVEPAPAQENAAVASDIPTLLLAGWFDPITPPEFAEAVRAKLTRSRYLLLEDASHGVVWEPLAQQAVSDFLDLPQPCTSDDCLAPGLAPLSNGIAAGSFLPRRGAIVLRP